MPANSNPAKKALKSPPKSGFHPSQKAWFCPVFTLLRMIALLIKAFREGRSPHMLGGGFALGLALGLIPGWPLPVWGLLVVVLIFAFNLVTVLAGALFGGVVGWLCAPWLDSLGAVVLQASVLQGMWTALYNTLLGAWLGFDNTQVMGSLLLAVVLAGGGMPLYVRAVRALQKLDQGTLQHPLLKPLVVVLQRLGLFKLYNTLKRLGLV